MVWLEPVGYKTLCKAMARYYSMTRGEPSREQGRSTEGVQRLQLLLRSSGPQLAGLAAKYRTLSPQQWTKQASPGAR